MWDTSIPGERPATSESPTKRRFKTSCHGRHSSGEEQGVYFGEIHDATHLAVWVSVNMGCALGSRGE